MKEKLAQEIQLNDVEIEHFKYVLKFIYEGDIALKRRKFSSYCYYCR